MRTIYYVLIFTISHIGTTLAQSRFYSVAGDRSAPNIENWKLTNPDTVGSAVVSLHYELMYVTDTVVGSHYTNRVIVQSDGVVSKYYILRRHIQDCVMTGVDKLLKGTASVPGAGGRYVKTDEEAAWDAVAGAEDILNSEIWRYCERGVVVERLHDYADRNLAVEYEEAIPVFNWRVSDEQSEICGHLCQMATARFAGREWTAWFSSEIPVDVGPWKFQGLPGAILKVADTQSQYVWNCVAISTTATPIIYYTVPTRKLPKKQYQNYLRMIHENPNAILGRGGDAVYYSKTTKKFLGNTWTVPYNPIELE